MTELEKDLQQCKEKFEAELEAIRDKHTKPKFWKPTDGKKAWYLELYSYTTSHSLAWSEHEIALGIAFKTKELAEKEIELRLATQRLKEAIFNLNDGEVEWDWKLAHTKKYFICLYDKTTIAWDYSNTAKYFPNWFHLKSGELCQELIESHEDDLMTYLSQ